MSAFPDSKGKEGTMTAATTAKRRGPGEGGAFSYQTRAGERWYWKATITGADGTARPVARRRGPDGEQFTTKKVALAAMREAQSKADKREWIEPSKMPLGRWLDEWAAGLQLGESTIASYRKNIRLHVRAYPIADIPLASLTSAHLAAHYRLLETSGRKDHRAGEGLSARTVRYIHTIIGAALSAAVSAQPPLLAKNPAADPRQSKPPSAKKAQAPEMHPWTAGQLRAFLDWSRENSMLHTAWWVLAYTGMRRGELLSLRWRDIDLKAGTITVRRSVGVVRNAGEGAALREGPTKTNKPRVVDLDPATAGVLRAWWRERHGPALQLAAGEEIVFADIEGRVLHPERFSRKFQGELSRCRKALGESAPRSSGSMTSGTRTPPCCCPAGRT
jgi:integrase